jgi:hypothetical protein
MATADPNPSPVPASGAVCFAPRLQRGANGIIADALTAGPAENAETTTATTATTPRLTSRFLKCVTHMLGRLPQSILTSAPW